ncbi:MAG: hypothetical protein KKA90_02045 [Nanoarchaeota archaeon]|nr:hypothetical protein [Nanoarchaeota archaeon]
MFKSKKQHGFVDLLILGIVAATIITVLVLLAKGGLIGHIVGIKSTVNLFYQIEDTGSGTITVLQTTSNRVPIAQLLGERGAEIWSAAKGETLVKVTDLVGIAIEPVEATFQGNTLIDLPVPGGGYTTYRVREKSDGA